MTLIERALTYFKTNSGSEFPDPDEPLPFHCPEKTTDQLVLYATKPRLFAEMELPGVSVIGGAGLRSESEIQVLANLSNDATIMFLGDCDPVDLLTFFVLRSKLEISFLGLKDQILDDLKGDVARMTLKMSPEEIRAVDLVIEFFPMLNLLIGDKLLSLFDSYRKVELEGPFNLSTLPKDERARALLKIIHAAE